jgi:hypothetical protein
VDLVPRFGKQANRQLAKETVLEYSLEFWLIAPPPPHTLSLELIQTLIQTPCDLTPGRAINN